MLLLNSNPITSLLLFLSITTLTFADVQIVALPNSCSSYPKYDNSTGIAGPWAVYSVANTPNSTIDGLRVSAETFTDDGVNVWGLTTLPKFPTYWSPNITLRCANSTLQALVVPVTSTSPNQTTWFPLGISTIENWQASLALSLPPSIPAQPYAHTTNGTRLPGTYLGVKGSTTWFFKYNFGGNAGEYYLVRWGGGYDGLVEGGRKMKRQDDGGFPQLDDRDWTGWLRVGEE
ncbi:hypothetical protein K491DRAFT_695112 [Lophiostoma macrostomum CBS 122681]|uniref:Uncharacterized protein n=1 Tax=Lophiostoma macrostomum CBS 122681 TaxID=1314788 RepID=A0A6A6SZ46_9PLEO|nr:hypothetical protein K491DRAFT_695112 [Lophiostoma macrostomum CBS 122681]